MQRPVGGNVCSLNPSLNVSPNIGAGHALQSWLNESIHYEDLNDGDRRCVSL